MSIQKSIVSFFLLFFLGFETVSAACNVDHTIDVTMPEGSRWEMCWTANDKTGIEFFDIYYTTASDDNNPKVRRKVLGEAHLAQLHVNYDDGSKTKDYVTSVGLGKSHLRRLSNADCFGDGAQLIRERGKKVLCSRVRDRNYLYRYKNGTVRQGHVLELFSISEADRHTWVVSWLFFEDGTIGPRIGTTGRLEKYGRNLNYGARVSRNRIAKSWVSNVFWRLNFDIAGKRNDFVQEFNVIKGGPGGSLQTLKSRILKKETGRNLEPQTLRSWRIVDSSETTPRGGHPISYQLIPQQGGLDFNASSQPWSKYEFYVTRYNRCEKYVEQFNRHRCGRGVRDFLNGQNVRDTDIVIWYGITRHHLPRDEDEPFRSLEWNEFRIYPRDWTDDSPLG